MSQDGTKRRIGRGISSLLGSSMSFEEMESAARSSSAFTVHDIAIEKIIANPMQPRKKFAHEELEDLAESIRKSGVLQPIIVSHEDGGKYKIIAGERRFRASILAEKKTIPCIIKDLSDVDSFVISMVENIQRANLNPLEEAYGYKKISEDYNIAYEDVAHLVGKSRSHVANMIGLLALPEETKALISDGKIKAGHAKVLKGLKDESRTIELAKKVADEKLSVRELEAIIQNKNNEVAEDIKELHSESAPVFDISSVPQFILDMEDVFHTNYPQLIQISHKQSGSGVIAIQYHNIDELHSIMEKMIDLADIYAK